MKALPILRACVALFLALNCGGRVAAEDSPKNVIVSMGHVKQLCSACIQWAGDHGGKFPQKVTELLVDGYLGQGQDRTLQCPLLGYDQKYGYFYNGDKLPDSAPSNKILFYSQWINAEGKRIVGHKDGSVALEVPKKEDYPDVTQEPGTSPATPSITVPDGPAVAPNILQSLVIVAGERALGSGFMVRLSGRDYLVTNSHVIRGQSKLTFTNMANQALQPGPLQIAAAADLVRAEISGASNVLQAEEKVESTVKIGDKVIVAGNSEGAGVAREIPGKVVGVGPDRIEVDAPFVSGNSGSPILLKSTGRVIGVATYAIIPKSLGTAKAKSANELNEVRRFGYRLDSVTGWVTPPQSDHLLKEGARLNQIETVELVVRAIFLAGPQAISLTGPGVIINKKDAAENPVLAALNTAVEEFSTKYRAATTPELKKQCIESMFKAMSTATANEVAGLQPDHFSGYFSTLFTRHLSQIKELQDWFSGGAVQLWLAGSAPGPAPAVAGNGNGKGKGKTKAKGEAPPADSGGLIQLTAHAAPKLKPALRYRVSFPQKEMPADKANYYWIVDHPNHQIQVDHLESSVWHLGATTESGTYKISIEYRAGLEKRVASNVVELTVP